MRVLSRLGNGDRSTVNLVYIVRLLRFTSPPHHHRSNHLGLNRDGRGLGGELALERPWSLRPPFRSRPDSSVESTPGQGIFTERYGSHVLPDHNPIVVTTERGPLYLCPLPDSKLRPFFALETFFWIRNFIRNQLLCITNRS